MKVTSFWAAYSRFDVAKVAAYTESDRERLLNDAGIIRNRLKINAAIENAKTILNLQLEYGSFEKWLEHHHPNTKEEWVKLFKNQPDLFPMDPKNRTGNHKRLHRFEVKHSGLLLS